MQLVDVEAQIHARKQCTPRFVPNTFSNLFNCNYSADPLATPSQTH